MTFQVSIRLPGEDWEQVPLDRDARDDAWMTFAAIKNDMVKTGRKGAVKICGPQIPETCYEQ